MWKALKHFLLYGTVQYSEDARVHADVMEENRKFSVIWSTSQMLYWAFCLLEATKAEDFWKCREIYAAAFIACTISLLLASYLVPKKPLAVHITALMVDLSLLGAGIGIATILAPKTIVIFASVLLVPVFFICDSFSTLILLIANAVAFALIGNKIMEAEAFKWTMMNLCIFSTVGLLLGYVINKTRYERYYFAESSERLAERLAQYAFYDQLTGLHNRFAYQAHVDKIEKNMPPDCCVVMADINGLKEANDTLGHDAGDELIIGAAECLRNSFGGIESIYRIGGDEFCVITNGTQDAIENCLRTLDACCKKWNGTLIHELSVSYGHAFASEYPDINAVLRAADKCMYENKSQYYSSVLKDRRKNAKGV